MDKMQAIMMINKAERDLIDAKQYDRAVNEGGEGYETAEAAGRKVLDTIATLKAAGFAYIGRKVYDADDWATIRAAWNSAILANQSKGQKAMLDAANKATGMAMSDIQVFKGTFAN